MFEKGDFELPLEKQLRLRVIRTEIDECHDQDLLREHLKQCTETLMKFQHLLNITLKKQLESDMTSFMGTIEEVIKQQPNGDT